MNYIYEENRIYAEDAHNLLLCEVTFPSREKSRVAIDHVYVDSSLRGAGIASEIMLLAYEYIKSKDLSIIAKCPYAIAWFKRHPEYQDIVVNVKTKETA